MLDTKEELRNLVEKGLARDIFKMEQSYSLIKCISNKGKSIDNFENGKFSRLFHVIQSSLLTDAIMSVSRIYDKPNSKNKTRCLLSILAFISKNNDDLIPIAQKPNLKKYLYEIDIDKYFIELVDINESLYGKMIADFFRSNSMNDENRNRITKLKNIRDKKIAHNEQIDFVEQPTLIDLKELIEFAKKVLGVIGWSYLNTAYVYEEKYFLSDDAIRVSFDLEKLFCIIGI